MRIKLQRDEAVLVLLLATCVSAFVAIVAPDLISPWVPFALGLAYVHACASSRA